MWNLVQSLGRMTLGAFGTSRDVLAELRGSLYDLSDPKVKPRHDVQLAIASTGEKYKFSLEVTDANASTPVLEDTLTVSNRLRSSPGPRSGLSWGIAFTAANRKYFFETTVSKEDEPFKDFLIVCAQSCFEESRRESSEDLSEASVLKWYLETIQEVEPPPAPSKPQAPIAESSSSTKANFFTATPVDGDLTYVGEGVATIAIQGGAIQVELGNRPRVTPITSDIDIHFVDRTNEVVWFDLETGKMCRFQFPSASALSAFKTSFIKALFFIRANEDFERATAEEKEQFQLAFDEPEEEEEEEEEDEIDIAPDEFASIDAEKDVFVDSPSRNSLAVAGRKTNRSYILRGNRIGVYQTRPNGVQYIDQHADLRDRAKDELRAEKAMVHEEDEHLVVLKEKDTKTIYDIDLERGECVSEFDSQGMSLRGLSAETHFAQSTPTKSFMALTNAGFFKVDTRIKKGIVNGENFQYKSAKGKNFTCMATTAEGDVVAGSKDGSIYLFDKKQLAAYKGTSIDNPLRARTVIPGLREEIIGIDVTKDGKLILATTRSAVLLYQNKPRGLKGENGFKVNLGKDLASRRPIVLKIKPYDLKKIGPVSFNPAKFNYSGTEHTIVSSTGSYLVTWNLSAARGRRNVYTLTPYAAPVVSDDVLHDTDGVVLSMPNAVKLAVRTDR